MEWETAEIHIYPWDDLPSILSRFDESPVFLRVREDLDTLLETARTTAEMQTSTVHIGNLFRVFKDSSLDLGDVIRMYPDDPPETIVRLYLRARFQNERLTEADYDGLFRFEFDPTLKVFKDMPYETFCAQVREEMARESIQKDREQLLRTLADQDPLAFYGWKSDHHRMRYEMEESRSLGQIFSEMDLIDPWILAVFHQKFFQWGDQDHLFAKTHREKDPRILELWRDGQLVQEIRDAGKGLYLYRPDMEIVLRENDDGTLEMEMELRPELLQQTLSILHIPSASIRSQKDIGMIGQFYFRDLYVPYTLFQDALMNDPLLSSFFYVNELKKISFENRLPVRFQSFFCSLLDIVPDKNETPHLFLKNIHRQTGFQVVIQLVFPIKESRLALFFLMMSRAMGRFQTVLRPACLEAYSRLLPDTETILEKQQKQLVKNLKGNRPEYFSKYPRMFVKNLYSVICQKNLQPEMISEEEARDIPKEHWIRFPERPIEEIDPEYYLCTNPKYPYAGLKEMSLEGEDVFINYAPCCFNSPQEKDNATKLARLKTKNDVEDAPEHDGRTKGKNKKDNIINGKFLIKYPGQIGTIRPPTMQRLFMALNPFDQYYRMGIRQSPSSFIACLLTARQIHGRLDRQDADEIRVRMSTDPDCIKACLQQNPGLSHETIQRDMADPNVYFDPRRFLPAAELFFQVRILVFTRPAEIHEEDAQILELCTMRSLYSNINHKPTILIFEHWGGKINILSKRPYPHNELIVYRSVNETQWRVDFDREAAFQVVDNLVYRFDGRTPIFPFDPKETSFTRHLSGQCIDPLGKVRALRFEVGGTEFLGHLDPPMNVQEGLPIIERPTTGPIEIIRPIIRFLQQFSSWTRIDIPDPNEPNLYWTVRQDRVFWKTLQDSSPLSLTFHFRLPAPRPVAILERSEAVAQIVHTGEPLPFLFFRPPENFTPVQSYIQEEKIARCLYDLCFSVFSSFLQQNQVRTDAIDPDVLLESFYQRAVRIGPIPLRPIDSPQQAIEDFLQDGRLRLPSARFWKKIRYNLKWHLFHYPEQLLAPRTVLMPSFYKQISDFGQHEEYFFFHLEQFGNVFRYSIEKEYELMTQRLETITSLPDFPLWYHQDESPYPAPHCLRILRSLEECRALSSTLFLWNKDLKEWVCIERGADTPLFISARGDESYIALDKN